MQCKYCLLPLTSVYSIDFSGVHLDAHEKKTHTSELICLFCQQTTFDNMTNTKIPNTEEITINEENLSCPKCFKTFVTSNGLLTHVRIFHFQCRYCDKTHDSSEELKIHMKSNHQQFSNFESVSELKSHIETKHMNG